MTLRALEDRTNHSIRVEVTDSGIGIDPKDQPRIFEEFYRVNNPAARKFAGSGLGLAILKHLVQAQGGKVALHSDGLGKGTACFFTLPRASSKQTPSKPNLPPILSKASVPSSDIAA